MSLSEAFATLGCIPAEYGDAVERLNRAEDRELQRKVKYYDRQEKIAIGIHKKNVREVERLHEKILKRNVRANDLEQFDKQRARIRNNYVSTSSPLAETKIPKESILSKDCSNVEVEGSSLRWKGQNGMNGLQTNSFQYSQMYGQNKKSFYGFSHVKT